MSDKIEVQLNGHPRSCVRGFISYKRLALLLKLNGEISKKEQITDFQVTEEGIWYGITDKKGVSND